MIFPFTNPTNTFLTFGLGRTPLSVNPAFKAKQSIDDITAFVREQKENIDNNRNFLVIEENVIEINSYLKKRFSILD